MKITTAFLSSLSARPTLAGQSTSVDGVTIGAAPPDQALQAMARLSRTATPDAASQKVQEQLQAAGDLGAAYLETLHTAVSGTTLAQRYDVLLHLARKDTGEYLDLPKLEPTVLEDYACILSTLREGDRLSEVADLFHSLSPAPCAQAADQRALFRFIRTNCAEDPDKIGALRSKDNWGVFLGARCAQAAQQPLGDETQQQRLDAIVRIATLHRDTFVSEWVAADNAIAHYQAVLESAKATAAGQGGEQPGTAGQPGASTPCGPTIGVHAPCAPTIGTHLPAPGEKFADLMNDYTSVLHGLVKSHRDPAQALDNFRALRALPEERRPRMRALLEGVGDMAVAQQASDFLDAIPPLLDRDARAQCATDLVRHLHDFSKARQTYHHIETCVRHSESFADAAHLVNTLAADGTQPATVRDAFTYTWRDLNHEPAAIERFRTVAKSVGMENAVRVHRMLAEPAATSDEPKRMQTFLRLQQVLGPRGSKTDNPSRKAEGAYKMLAEVVGEQSLPRLAEQFLRVHAAIEKYGASDEPDASLQVFRDLVGMRPTLPHGVEMFRGLMEEVQDTEEAVAVCREIATAPGGARQAEEAMQALRTAHGHCAEAGAVGSLLESWKQTKQHRIDSESMLDAARRMADLIVPTASPRESKDAFARTSQMLEKGAEADRFTRVFRALGTVSATDEALDMLPDEESEAALISLASAETECSRGDAQEALRHYRHARDHRLGGEPLAASAARLRSLAIVSRNAEDAAREAFRYLCDGDLGVLPADEATTLMLEALGSKRSLQEAREWVRVSIQALSPRQTATVTRGQSHVTLGNIKVPVR